MSLLLKIKFSVLTNMVLFRPNRSFYMAIKYLYCKITDDLDNKRHSLGIFLDLSKAFDTLNHDIPLHKLNTYGIRGLANSWIQNYLSNRKQYVAFNNSTSTHNDGFLLRAMVHFIFFYTLTIFRFYRPPPTSLFLPMILISFFLHKDPVRLVKTNK